MRTPGRKLERRKLSDHDQSPDSTLRTQSKIKTRHFEHHLASSLLWGWVWLCLNPKKLTTLREVLLLRAICEEAEVANPHETIRQDVEQEATDELIRLKRH